MTEVELDQSDRHHNGDTSPAHGNFVPQALDSLRKVQQNCELLLNGKETDVHSSASRTSRESLNNKQLINETLQDLNMCVTYLETAVYSDVFSDDFPAKLREVSSCGGSSKSLESSRTPMSICLSDLSLRNQDLTMSILKQQDRWGIDLFRIEELTDNRALTAVMFTVLSERNFFDKFEIECKKFITFMKCLCASYKPLPFHSSTHAADVVLTASVFLNSKVLRDCFTDLEVLSILVGCAIHDIGHPGYSNLFLANSGSDISLVYGSSCLERYHLARGLALLQQPSCDILNNLSPADTMSAKELIQHLILATDNDNHKEVMAEMSKVCGKLSTNISNSVKTLTQGERLSLLRGIIHTADLSNPAKPFNLYDNWCQRVMSEFYRQGDREKVLGIPVTPICDRRITSVSGAQVPFITYLVSPLFDVWFNVPIDEVMKAKDFLRENCAYHDSRIKKD